MTSSNPIGRLLVVLACTGLCLAIASDQSVAASTSDDAARQADKTSAPLANDKLFVAKPGQDGVYTEVNGTIRKLTCNEIIVDVDGKQTLYERKAVRRVTLSQSQSDEIKKQATICWNQEDSQFVSNTWKTFQTIPVIGQVLSAFSDSLNSPAVKMTLVILILAGLLIYVAYKAYEIFYIATNMRNLNIDKLSMEVRKLRYELDAIEMKMGVLPAAKGLPAEMEETTQQRARYHFELPQLRILDFVKYKILRVLMDEEKKKRLQNWRMTWQAYREKPAALRWLGYKFISVLYLVITALVGMSVLVFFIGVFVGVSDPELGLSFSALFLVLAIIFLSLLLRLLVQRRIIRDAYRETFQETASGEAKTS
jgi:hypothetical protein